MYESPRSCLKHHATLLAARLHAVDYVCQLPDTKGRGRAASSDTVDQAELDHPNLILGSDPMLEFAWLGVRGVWLDERQVLEDTLNLPTRVGHCIRCL